MRRLYTFYFALLMPLMVFVSIETGWAQSATFNCTMGAQSFIVPGGVVSIHIEAYGAEGGGNDDGRGGEGGFAEGDLAVTPGETLDIFVGCAGVLINGVGGGGFNGGGNARATVDPGNGGGGGASDVRQGGNALGMRVIVAGGGGGGCPNAMAFIGGDGGFMVGLPGTSTGTNHGLGGTQSAGGAGGLSGACGAGTSGKTVALLHQ